MSRIAETAMAAWLVVLCLASPLPAGEATRAALPRIRVAQNSRTLETETGQPFVPFGINYYRPRTGWAPQVWKKFDPEATRRDFARLKELGGNCVRVFLSYGSFCPEAGVANAEALARFDRFLALAEEAGIYVHPAGLDHWEGSPAWVRAEEDIAGDRRLASLESFWRQFAARYRGRGVLFAYDLRNEPEVPWDGPTMRQKWNSWLAKRYRDAGAAAAAWGSNVTQLTWGHLPPPPAQDALTNQLLLDYQSFREDIADEWTRRQAAAIKSADPQALVTVGLIQWSVPALLPGVKHYSAFRPSRQARYLDFLEIHFYPLVNGFYTYERAEDEAANLSYLESVVREVAATGKPVVVAEFGWYGGGKPTLEKGRYPFASEEQQAQWNRKLVETTAGLACGWLNWGFHDHPEATDVSQLTGLLTVEGKTKAWGAEFQRLSAQLGNQFVPPKKTGPRPALDWDRCVTSLTAAREHRDAFLRARQERP